MGRHIYVLVLIIVFQQFGFTFLKITCIYAQVCQSMSWKRHIEALEVEVIRHQA